MTKGSSAKILLSAKDTIFVSSVNTATVFMSFCIQVSEVCPPSYLLSADAHKNAKQLIKNQNLVPDIMKHIEAGANNGENKVSQIRLAFTVFKVYVFKFPN